MSIKSRIKKLLNIRPETHDPSIIYERYPGAWQHNDFLCKEDYTRFFAVFSCITLIASDIAKMRILPQKRLPNGLTVPVRNKAISSLLEKPNQFQTRIQFIENWISSLLLHGNTYVYLSRRNGLVKSMHILDPKLVKPVISDDGEVFYQLCADNITGITEQIAVTAREIIHDRINCLHHPLIGRSPLYAAALAASHGLSIQRSSTVFFQNGSRPSGVITAPGNISAEVVKRLKETWQSEYSGQGQGGAAILSGGMDYKPMTMTAIDSQMIEMLDMSAKIICSVFHVPPYKIGIEQAPANNPELDIQYYKQCIQPRIAAIELLLSRDLELAENIELEFDVSELLRMDAKSRFETWSLGVNGGWLKINEARARENLQPIEGGDTPYLQQQNYSLAALAKRDAGNPLSSTVSETEDEEDAESSNA